MYKKYFFAFLSAALLLAPISIKSQTTEPKEYKMTIRGLAPTIMLPNAEKVDIIALIRENNQNTALTLLQYVTALKAQPKGGNSEVTLLLTLAQIQEIADFEKQYPNPRYTLIVRGIGDTEISRIKKVSFYILFN